MQRAVILIFPLSDWRRYGCGDQVLTWLEEFDVKHVSGLEIAPSQVFKPILHARLTANPRELIGINREFWVTKKMEIPGEWSDFDVLGLVGELLKNDFFGGGMVGPDLLVLEISP